MVAALVGTVFFITRITRNLDHSDLASTGEGEGLEDFMLTHDQHHDPHQFRTARERDHDHAHHLQQHDTHAHQLHDSAVDADGSIVVQTADKPAGAPPVLAPAHTVGGDAAAHAAAGGAAAAHTGSHSEAAAAATQQQHAAHPAVPAAQQAHPAVPDTAQQAAPQAQQRAAHTDQQPAAHVEHHAAAATQQQAVPAVQQPAAATPPQQQQPAQAVHEAPKVQPPKVHNQADAVVAVDAGELPEPAEEGAAAAAPAQHHAHHAHAARLDSHSPATGLYALTAVDIDGRERHLSEFAGKVTLVVNVASQCGFTDANYKGLQEAYNKYHKFGFEVLAFPSNEFGNQEPGSNADIKSFCTDRYHTTFPIFSKVQVNGPSAHPVFQYLRRELPADQGGGGGVAAGKDIGWNFYKFLVGRDGKPVKLFHQQWQQAVVEHAVYEMLVDPQYVLDSGMHHG